MAPILRLRQARLLPVVRGRRKGDVWGEEFSQTPKGCSQVVSMHCPAQSLEGSA